MRLSIVWGNIANPNIEKATRLERKIAFGAEFVQTQIIFDVASPMDARRAYAWLTSTAGIMAGIMVIKSAQSARFLRDHLPGSRVPESIIERMEAANDPEAEGITIAANYHQLFAIEGVPRGTFDDGGLEQKRFRWW
jgi:methylenetetrahydrofolate reductase (NADPH)